MGDIQTTKAAETTRVKQKTEDRPPHEREYAPPACAETMLFRVAANDDPGTPPQHMARALRRLTAPQQTTFLLQCQRRYGNAYVQRMVSYLDNGQTLQTRPLAAPITPTVPRQMENENEVKGDKDREEEKDESLQAKSFSESAALPLQGKGPPKRKKPNRSRRNLLDH